MDGGAPVQRKAVDPGYGDIVAAARAPAPSAGVQQAAAQGIAGAGGPLPHAETIQPLFGPHDVGDIEAHVGGAAAAASRAIGAEAYTTGHHVAFTAAPSLHTAAHEAAHVVQQRGGVQLQDGVGQAGDRYERHADEVADRVVAGRDASDLLDGFAVGGAHGTGAVQRKDLPRPVAMVLTVDDSGVLRDEQGSQAVGFQGDDGKPYVAVDGKGNRGVALTTARLGTIRFGTGEVVIERVEEVTLEPVPEVDAVSGGTPPDPKRIANQRRATFSGKVLAVIDQDGSPILERGGSGWQPIEPSKLAPGLAGELDEDTRISLDDGRSWMWMSFVRRGEKGEAARWVSPKSSTQEVTDREKIIRAEADKLPDGIRDAVDQVIKTIYTVSAVESGFGGTSELGDTSGSLGIFQWGMEASSNAEAGSLGKFFRTLKARADVAGRKPAKDRTDEDKLYIAAWQQCLKHHLSVTASQILIGGKAATGGEVEHEMSDEMGKGSLRTYQMIAARDWIDEFRAKVVRPGPRAAARAAATRS